jgi:hypothetical protein
MLRVEMHRSLRLDRTVASVGEIVEGAHLLLDDTAATPGAADERVATIDHGAEGHVKPFGHEQLDGLLRIGTNRVVDTVRLSPLA